MTQSCSLLVPPNIAESGSFLGMCKVSRGPVPKFSKMTARLNHKLQKSQPTIYSELSHKELDGLEKSAREAQLITWCWLLHDRWAQILWKQTLATAKVGAYFSRCNLVDNGTPSATGHDRYQTWNVHTIFLTENSTARNVLTFWAVVPLHSYLEYQHFIMEAYKDALK